MKVFIFGPSNEFIGKFSISTTDEIKTALASFLETRGPVPANSYIEVSGKAWTIVSLSPLDIREGRIVDEKDRPSPLPLVAPGLPKLRLSRIFNFFTLGWIVIPVCSILLVMYFAFTYRDPFHQQSNDILKLIFGLPATIAGLGGWWQLALWVASVWYDVIHGSGSTVLCLVGLALLFIPVPIAMALRMGKRWGFVVAHIWLGLSPIFYIWRALESYITVIGFFILVGVYVGIAILWSIYLVKAKMAIVAQLSTQIEK